MSDARTRQYTGGATADTPIAVAIAESVHTRAGQVALYAITNATVRNHPVVSGARLTALGSRSSTPSRGTS